MTRDNYILMNPGLRSALDVVELLPACFPLEPDADHWAAESSPFCKAIIAGGAPRDLLLGRLVKDYDCFWPVSRSFVTGAAVVAVQRLETAGLPWTFINGAGSAYDKDTQISRRESRTCNGCRANIRNTRWSSPIRS